MTAKLTIAVDAMGGDGGADTVIQGVAKAATQYPDTHFLLFGQEKVMAPLVENQKALKDRITILHTDDVIGAEDKPSLAVRRGRNSSMAQAINAVKDGRAKVAVSAGNTGALMALALFTLRTMPGIERPALSALLPALKREVAMLDLGANVECSEENLVQFAIMGAAFSRTVLGKKKPKVALLNIGVEELKGNEVVKNADRILRNATGLPLEFTGFVEGDMIGLGKLDVIVTDGFTGNIALKTAEGTAKLIRELLKRAFFRSFVTKVGFFLAKGGLSWIRKHLDPNTHNGGVFLGLNGLVVKSHGSASADGFAMALRVGHDMAKNKILDLINKDLEKIGGPEGQAIKKVAE